MDRGEGIRQLIRTHTRLLLIAFCAWHEIPFAQSPYADPWKRQQALNAYEAEKANLHKEQVSASTEASGWFDVTYDSLALNVDAQTTYLKGTVTIAGICRQDSSRQLTLDLSNAMHIDSVLVNRAQRPFVQASNSFTIALDRFYHSGEILSATVFYGGIPVPTGFGSFVFSSHSGVPWIYTLSEPYGAKDWWPCKNDPSDKADSADILITCDSVYRVGSEGILVSVVNSGNGKSVHHWREHYPIASYLISIALSNYVQFSNWYRYSATDSMEVLNYVLPEDYADALQNLPLVIDMLSIYASLYGEYPFIKEKYGHSEFALGGMEHQTMTSIASFQENVMSHELAHQWFGDMITCRTWSDLWLNEGFAQYSTALYLEKKYGVNSYWGYMNGQINSGTTASGEIGAPDTSTASSLFNSPLIYSKGASVLHMLRHVLGDSMFFRALHAYANDPQLRYSTATTQDFESVCETVSGKDLGYFFHEWIYGEGFPDYEYSWNWKSTGSSYTLTLDITQPPDRTNPAFFTMPIDVRITANGRDTTVSIFNDAATQSFTFHCSSQPTSVALDPDGWILKLTFPASKIPPTELELDQNYPNPFNSATKIKYSLPKREHVSLGIYDMLGRRIAVLVDGNQLQGSYEVEWSPEGMSSGVYVYRLIAGDAQMQKKMIILR